MTGFYMSGFSGYTGFLANPQCDSLRLSKVGGRPRILLIRLAPE